MASERRRGLATATLGAAGLAAGGKLNARVTRRVIEALPKEPRNHQWAVLRHGSTADRRKYIAGSTLMGVSSIPFTVGAHDALKLPKKETTAKRDKNSFLREGVRGTGDSLKLKVDSVREPVPLKLRASQAGIGLGSAWGGSKLASQALKHHPGVRPAVAPIAGALTGLATLPLSNRVVQRQNRDYVVTPTGVRRQKKAVVKPSSKTSRYAPDRRSLRTDVGKGWKQVPLPFAGIRTEPDKKQLIAATLARDPRHKMIAHGRPGWKVRAESKHGELEVGKREKYLGAKTPYAVQRAQITAAGVPVVGPVLQARRAAQFAPPKQKAKAAARQMTFGAGAGLAAGFAGAHAGAALAEKTPVGTGAEKLIGRMEKHPLARHFIPRIPESKRALLKPLTSSPKKTAAATAGFFLARGITTGIGNQRAITANQADQDRYNRRHHITKRAQNLALATPPVPKEAHRLARRKRLNANLSMTAGALGLSSLGALAMRKPQRALQLSVGGSGVGGLNAFVGAKVQRKEAKAIDPKTKAANLAKAFKPMPFLHPRASGFSFGRVQPGHLASMPTHSLSAQLQHLKQMPYGPQADAKTMRALSGRDFGETVSRVGRATRRQDKEFSTVVHPISGRILDMRRGDMHSTSVPVMSAKLNRRSFTRMAELAESGSSQTVRDRAMRNVQGENKNLAGPSLVSLHNHPAFEPGVHRHAPSAQDTQAMRGMGDNIRMGVLSHRPAPRGQAQTKLTMMRNYPIAAPSRALGRSPAETAIRDTERRLETQDRATVPNRFISQVFPHRDAPDAVDYRKQRRRALKRAARTSDGRITDYSAYFRAKTGNRAAAEQTGLYSRTTLHKADLPKYAVHSSFGKVRVLTQHSKDHFMVLTNRDEKRLLHRSTLTFTNRVSKIALRLVHHGTDSAALKGIRRKGWQARNEGERGGVRPDSRGEGVYVGSHRIASGFARQHAGKDGRVMRLAVSGPVQGLGKIRSPGMVDGTTGEVITWRERHASMDNRVGGLVQPHQIIQSHRVSKRDDWRKREPLKTSVSPDDARKLVERHGLKGPLPKGLDREQKRAAYEARYVSAGGHKAEHWQRRAVRADKVKTAGLAGITGSGAVWLGTRGKRTPVLAARAARRLGAHHPPSREHVARVAETAAVAAGTVGGAGELYAGHARRKRSSYASAPAGVAASALRRMQDYDRSTA